jgi:hypothetical protein
MKASTAGAKDQSWLACSHQSWTNFTVRHLSATSILGGGTDLDMQPGAERREPRTPTGHDAGISKGTFKNIQLRVHQTSEIIVEYLFVSPV